MTDFTDSERAYLNEMRALTTDSQGREVLVGLTAEETEFYRKYAKERLAGTGGADRRADGNRYLELHEKRERARFAVLAAENQLRNDGPVRH